MLGRFALVLVVTLLVLAGMESPLAAETPAPTAPEIGVDEKLGQTVPLDISLLDEQGERVTLSKLIDKPTILTLNYFRCTGLCSPLLNGVAQMMQRMHERPGKDFQVLTVSFDPRDNPELAQHKRENYTRQLGADFPPAAWRFLTGDPGSTKRLADAVGFRFTKVGDGYVHPGVIMVLSPTGKISRYLYGISFLPFDVKMALIEAAEGRTGPTINRLVALCYSYDPAGRSYVFNITRVAGAFTLLLAGVFVGVVLLRGRHKKDEPAPSNNEAPPSNQAALP